MKPVGGGDIAVVFLFVCLLIYMRRFGWKISGSFKSVVHHKMFLISL